MNYNDLDKLVTSSLKENNSLDRAVSVDIEADLETLKDPNKHMLSISTARRNGGNIEIKNFVLNEETQEDEIRILNEFGTFCEEIRPLVLIGYGIGRFDLPLLLGKMRHLDDLFKVQGRYQSGYWAFRDAITRGYVLDMINPVRFDIARFDNTSPKFLSLEYAIAHKRFEHLPFRRVKNIVSDKATDSKTKWDVIREFWKDDRDSFNKYIEGDVHDTLLLSEEIFQTV